MAWPVQTRGGMKKKVLFGGAFGLAAVLIVVASVLIAGGREDRGFLNGKPPVLPVRVAIEPGSEDWLPELKASIDWWNDACGLKLLTFAALDAASVWVRVDAAMAGDDTPGSVENPFTRIRTDGRAEIVLPPANAFPFAVRRLRVMSHELGHALRLDHDDFIESVMYPRASTYNGSTGDFEVLGGDCVLLRLAVSSRDASALLVRPAAQQ